MRGKRHPSGTDNQRAAAECHGLVVGALSATKRIQLGLMGSAWSDFDRIAINNAVQHLEWAIAELACFVAQKNERGH